MEIEQLEKVEQAARAFAETFKVESADSASHQALGADSARLYIDLWAALGGDVGSYEVPELDAWRRVNEPLGWRNDHS